MISFLILALKRHKENVSDAMHANFSTGTLHWMIHVSVLENGTALVSGSFHAHLYQPVSTGEQQ